mmetsp:Transcript_47985/g.54377  ORF Transcript_47985/g.54377 Transcript_47985/m.54377 type:complete len:143 (+) Transcript_47985:83-511(+)
MLEARSHKGIKDTHNSLAYLFPSFSLSRCITMAGSSFLYHDPLFRFPFNALDFFFSTLSMSSLLSLSSSSSSLSSNTNTHTNRTKQRASAPDKDNILVGVFDVNHTYGGAYLVPARRLYESVKAMDISVSKPRATIILSVEE